MASTQEHISRLQEAQDLLREALDILKDVYHDGDYSSANGAYVIPNLEVMITSDHPYMSRDYNVADWIKEIENADDDDTKDDDPFVYHEPTPTDPATFPHTPEFAAKLYAEYGRSNQRIAAIRDYRYEYGVGLKAAKDAVYHIFDSKEQS